MKSIKIRHTDIICVDLDGTLINSDLANFLAYKNAIQKIISIANELSYSPGNRLNRSQLKSLFPGLTEIEFFEIIHEKEKLFQNYLDRIKINHELLKILNEYKLINKLYLVTNCRMSRVLQIIEYFQISDLFDRFFTLDDTVMSNANNKYQNVVNSKKTHPDQFIVFENESIEIENAIAVGIPRENIHKI